MQTYTNAKRKYRIVVSSQLLAIWKLRVSNRQYHNVSTNEATNFTEDFKLSCFLKHLRALIELSHCDLSPLLS